MCWLFWGRSSVQAKLGSSASFNILVLHDELWHEVKPGLSSFADSPDKGGETILQLIQIAKGRILVDIL